MRLARIATPHLASGAELRNGAGPALSVSRAAMWFAARYRITRFIGRGGMGEVYEAEDLELNERVALEKRSVWKLPMTNERFSRFKKRNPVGRARLLTPMFAEYSILATTGPLIRDRWALFGHHVSSPWSFSKAILCPTACGTRAR